MTPQESAEKHLKLINAFAGFCYDIKNWPNFLYKNGYKVYAVEWAFKNSKSHEVSFELILKSLQHKNAILLECKSSSVDNDQMIRYGEIILDDVVQRAGVSVETFDITYFSFEENSKEVCDKVSANKFNFTSLVMGEDYVEKRLNDFKNSAVNHDLQSKILLDQKYLPEKIVPFSPDGNYPVEKLTKQVILGLMQLLISEKHQTLSSETFVKDYLMSYNLFDSYGRIERQNVINRVQEILKSIVKKYFSDYIEIRAKGSSGVLIIPNVYDIKKTPRSSADPKNINKEIKNIIKLANEANSEMGDKGSISYQMEIGDIMPNLEQENDVEIESE